MPMRYCFSWFPTRADLWHVRLLTTSLSWGRQAGIRSFNTLQGRTMHFDVGGVNTVLVSQGNMDVLGFGRNSCQKEVSAKNPADECNGDFATVTPSLSYRRVTGVAVLARFPPKIHDGPDSAASHLFLKQQVALRGRGPLKCTV